MAQAKEREREATVEAEAAGEPAAAGKQQRAGQNAEKQAKRLMQPAGCRSYMRRRLAKEFPEIVDGFVEEAKKGSCPHVKLATEFLRPVRKGTSRRKSEATKLLDDLLGE
jgi:hypothetical protein